MTTEPTMTADLIDGMLCCLHCGQRAGTTDNGDGTGYLVHDRTGRVECEPAYMQTDIDYMTQRRRCAECGGFVAEGDNGEPVHVDTHLAQCPTRPASTWERIGPLDSDSDYLDLAAALLYLPGDERARAWPDPQTLGRIRSRLRGMADEISQRTVPPHAAAFEVTSGRDLHSFDPAAWS